MVLATPRESEPQFAIVDIHTSCMFSLLVEEDTRMQPEKISPVSGGNRRRRRRLSAAATQTICASLNGTLLLKDAAGRPASQPTELSKSVQNSLKYAPGSSCRAYTVEHAASLAGSGN